MNPHSVSQGVKFINNAKGPSQDHVDAYCLIEEFHHISLAFNPSLCDLAMMEILKTTIYQDLIHVPFPNLQQLWENVSICCNEEHSAPTAIMPPKVPG